jgi:hypothetical protein
MNQQDLQQQSSAQLIEWVFGHNRRHGGCGQLGNSRLLEQRGLDFELTRGGKSGNVAVPTHSSQHRSRLCSFPIRGDKRMNPSSDWQSTSKRAGSDDFTSSNVDKPCLKIEADELEATRE